MIDRVTGTVLAVESEAAVLDLHGLGLRLELSPPTATRLRPGAKVTLLTQLLISGGADPAPRLVGFFAEDERRLFRLLLGVAGIGPSHALRILGSLPEPGLVAAAIARGDEKALKVKGVGPKLAKRVITELKDKLEGVAGSVPLPVGLPAAALAPVGPLDDALRALRELEFDPQEARRLLEEVRIELEAASADELVRAVLMRA